MKILFLFSKFHFLENAVLLGTDRRKSPIMHSIVPKGKSWTCKFNQTSFIAIKVTEKEIAPQNYTPAINTTQILIQPWNHSFIKYLYFTSYFLLLTHSVTTNRYSTNLHLKSQWIRMDRFVLRCRHQFYNLITDQTPARHTHIT